MGSGIYQIYSLWDSDEASDKKTGGEIREGGG